MDAAQRNQWLTAPDADLLAECEVDTYRSSGPGGQHRNKTSSAVRLRHRPTSLVVIAEEERSQHANKARAVKRLRRAIALQVRVKPGLPPAEEFQECLTAAGRIEVSRRNPRYPVAVATVLDAVHATSGQVREAAGLLGLSTGQLSKFVVSDGKMQEVVNRLRRQAGLKPLTSG